MTIARVLLALLLSAPVILEAAPKAFLRQNGPIDSASGYYIAVTFDPPATAVTQAVLYAGDPGVIPLLPGMPDAFGAPFTFAVAEENQKALLTSRPLNLVIRYTSAGTSLDALVPVALETTASFAPQGFVCQTDIVIAVGTVAPDSTGYLSARVKQLGNYIARHAPGGRIQYQGQESALGMTVTIREGQVIDTRQEYCMSASRPLKPGIQRIEIAFPAGAPPELAQPFRNQFNIAFKKNTPAAIDTGTVGKRALEQNLDLGIQFASSVENKKSGGTTIRERTTRGTLDLRLAPLLNLLPTPKVDNRLFTFWTPVYVDARVSTDKLTDSTLAQNRIVYGSDFELRAYGAKSGAYPTFHRFISGFRSSNDRDFHQSEYKVIAEYRPVIGPLNKPLAVELPLRVPWEIGSDFNEIPIDRTFGGSVLPVFGYEYGRNVHNKDNSIASTSVTRLYIGASAQLDITRRVKVTATDLMYRRYESDSDPWHNYFVSSLEMPLPAFSLDSAHSIFATFERGGQPPFNSPDVNSVRVGYRIQMQNWFGRWR